MESVIILSLSLVVGLIALSQYFAFRVELDNEKFQFKYMILAVSVAMAAILEVIMILAYGTRVSFIIYAVDKFFKVLIMVETIMLTYHMIDIKNNYVSHFISIVSYGAVALYFIDIFAKGDGLEFSEYGVYYHPQEPWHQVLYLSYYMVYVFVLIAFLVYKNSGIVRRCEKHELTLLFFVYVISAAGYVTETYMVTYGMIYFPVGLFTNLLSLICMRKLLNYHDAITVEPEKFPKELDMACVEPALVINDKMVVIYQNKRAEVCAKILGDIYMDRKLSEIFSFNDAAYGMINADPDEIPFGLTAVYNKNGRQVNMIIQHRVDNYGEILATGVRIYNMEEVEKSDKNIVSEPDEDEEQMIQNAIAITNGARVLVVDDNIVFLNVFCRILQKYSIEITRAIGGKEALNAVGNSVYDIIFISYDMSEMDGKETVSRIRSMAGEYYRQVPIVFITELDINEVFNEFIEAGFNDYLSKPVSKRSLNAVLTRWLWQRFAGEADSGEDIIQENNMSGELVELERLINTANQMLNNGKYEFLNYCINGIKRICMIIKRSDIVDIVSELEEAIMFEDTEEIKRLFSKLKNEVDDVVRI